MFRAYLFEAQLQEDFDFTDIHPKSGVIEFYPHITLRDDPQIDLYLFDKELQDLTTRDIANDIPYETYTPRDIAGWRDIKETFIKRFKDNNPTVIEMGIYEERDYLKEIKGLSDEELDRRGIYSDRLAILFDLLLPIPLRVGDKSIERVVVVLNQFEEIQKIMDRTEGDDLDEFYSQGYLEGQIPHIDNTELTKEVIKAINGLQG